MKMSLNGGVTPFLVLILLAYFLSLGTSQITAVPTVTFNKGTYFANEGNTLTIEIMRDGDGGDDITVGVRSVDTNSATEPDDFSLPTTVTIAPGATGMLNIPIVADETTEGLETFEVMLVASSNNEYSLGDFTQLSLATVVILDTSANVDPILPPAVYFNKGTYIVNEGDDLMIQILRSGGDEPIDVAFRAVDTNSARVLDDFAAPPATVTIPPGAAGMLNIPIIADNLTENLETLDMIIVPSDTMEYRLVNMRLGRATVIIADTSVGGAGAGGADTEPPKSGTKMRKIQRV